MTDNRHIFHKTRQWRSGSWAELDLRLSDGCRKHREHGEGDHNVVAVKGSSRGRGRGWRGRRARPRAWCPRMRPPPPPGLTPGTSPSSRSSQSSLTSGTKQQVGDFYLTSLIFRWGWHNNFDFDCDTLCRNIEFPKINIIH